MRKICEQIVVYGHIERLFWPLILIAHFNVQLIFESQLLSSVHGTAGNWQHKSYLDGKWISLWIRRDDRFTNKKCGDTIYSCIYRCHPLLIISIPYISTVDWFKNIIMYLCWFFCLVLWLNCEWNNLLYYCRYVYRFSVSATFPSTPYNCIVL